MFLPLGCSWDDCLLGARSSLPGAADSTALNTAAPKAPGAQHSPCATQAQLSEVPEQEGVSTPLPLAAPGLSAPKSRWQREPCLAVPGARAPAGSGELVVAWGSHRAASPHPCVLERGDGPIPPMGPGVLGSPFTIPASSPAVSLTAPCKSRCI